MTVSVERSWATEVTKACAFPPAAPARGLLTPGSLARRERQVIAAALSASDCSGPIPGGGTRHIRHRS